MTENRSRHRSLKFATCAKATTMEGSRRCAESISPLRRANYIAISGASGSGKSTLLHLLGGLDVPTSGQVLFKGQTLDHIGLDDYRARQLGFIFQAFHLIPTLRAIENVQVPMLATGTDASTRATRAEALLVGDGTRNIVSTSIRMSFRRESGREWPSRVLWPTIPPCSWPMSQPGISTA